MKKGEYNPKQHAISLYSMLLHETIGFSKELYVTRVPGGWIYDRCALDENNKYVVSIESMFVPYSDEFKIFVNPVTAQDILEPMSGE